MSNNQDKRRGVQQPKGTPPGNGKVVQFPGEQTQPPPTEAQLAMAKRIEAAGENILAAISDLSLLEVKGTLETVNGFLQKRIYETMNTAKMEAPSADDTTETAV